MQRLPLRGHDESEGSSNRENFLELLHFLTDHNEGTKAIVLKNAPENLELTSPDIHKDIVNAAATEITISIINDIGDEFFSILVDESRDVSIKEQMAVALRYVNEKGHLIECFLGVEHVTSTTALLLKAAIDALFARYGLSIFRLCGQGYDGASNMQGEFNGLKTLIMRENESAYYVHALLMDLIAVAKNHSDISWFFNSVTSVVNVVGASCKRRNTLRGIQATKVIEALNGGELSSGRGLNQEISVKRSCDTCWGSHYETLISLISLFSAVIDVLEIIHNDGSNMEQRGEARGLLFLMHKFDFIFNVHLMRTMLAITNELSLALQRKEQDIVNAMHLVELSKKRLQIMRKSGWDSFLDQVSSFCGKHGIDIPNMDDKYLVAGRPRHGGQEITNLHHYRVGLFFTILYMQLQELNNRFTEANSELPLCVTCLSPNDSFFAFNRQKLIRIASLYPNDFSIVKVAILEDQLDAYIFDMCSSSEFLGLRGLVSLAQKWLEQKEVEYIH